MTDEQKAAFWMSLNEKRKESREWAERSIFVQQETGGFAVLFACAFLRDGSPHNPVRLNGFLSQEIADEYANRVRSAFAFVVDCAISRGRQMATSTTEVAK